MNVSIGSLVYIVENISVSNDINRNQNTGTKNITNNITAVSIPNKNIKRVNHDYIHNK